MEELAKRGHLDSKIEDMLPYIKNKRIEIDSVLAEVGNESFWNFCLSKLRSLWKNRNYNRAINIPQNILPEKIDYFVENIKEKCNEVTADKRVGTEGKLVNFTGFISDVNNYERNLESELRDILSNDTDIQSLVRKIEEFGKQ